jgi:uncharacterized membrane protein YgcG
MSENSQENPSEQPSTISPQVKQRIRFITISILGVLFAFVLIASTRGWGYPSPGVIVQEQDGDSTRTTRTHVSHGYFSSSYFYIASPSVREGSVGGSTVRGGSFRGGGK